MEKILRQQLLSYDIPERYRIGILTLVRDQGENAVSEMVEWMKTFKSENQAPHGMMLKKAIEIAEKYGLKPMKLYY